MKQSGYIALDRGIFDHRIFKRRPEWFRAWTWLIAHAAWKPEGRRGGFGVVHVERGQTVVTLRELGTAWGWPKSNVDRFLKRLVREGMIETRKSGTTTGTGSGTALSYPVTIVTICNYDKFQSSAPHRGVREQGQKAGQEAGQGLQESLPLQGLPAPQPSNQRTKDRGSVEKSGGKRGTSGTTVPKHGQRAKSGKVFWHYETPEWHIYADDFRSKRGVLPLPNVYLDGRGRWFNEYGESGDRAVLWSAERIAKFG